MYMFGERNDKGIKVTSVTFHNSLEEIFQILHIKYINLCMKLTKSPYHTQEELDRYTFHYWLDGNGSRYVIYECIPGEKTENLNKNNNRRKLLEQMEEAGYTVDK